MRFVPALIPITVSAALAGCATTAQTPAETLPPSAADIAGQRQRIASFLEGEFEFRTISDDGAPRLRGAKIGGPWFGAPARLFVTANAVDYCVVVDTYVFPTAPVTRYIAIDIMKNEDGSERIRGVMPSDGSKPALCGKKELEPVQPFAELEEARKKRRRAMGKEP